MIHPTSNEKENPEAPASGFFHPRPFATALRGAEQDERPQPPSASTARARYEREDPLCAGDPCTGVRGGSRCLVEEV